MKRPITSPSCAVFTSSETITLMPSRALARLERARDLVVVGDRDRAQAAALCGVEQHVDRRRAVRRVVGVHVQVAVDEVARRQSLARSRAVGRRPDGGGRSRAGRRPRPRRPRRSQPSCGRCGSGSGGAAPTQQLAIRDTSRASCAASTSASPGSNSSPSVAVAQHLLVDGDARRDRNALRRRSPSGAVVARGATPADAAHSTSARASSDSSGSRRGPDSRTRSRSAPAEPRGTRHAARATRPSRATARSSGRRRSARRKSRSAARSSSATNAISHGPSRSRAPGRKRSRSTPGRHDVVVAREEARDQAARDVEGGHARVEAAEEQLDEPARDLRREHALGGRVEAPDVQRARVAQRGGRRRWARTARARARSRAARARAACRSCGVASSGSETRPPRRARRGEASASARAPAPRPARTATRDRAAAARISRRDSRTCAREPLGRQHEHAVPALREPVRDALDVLVDLPRRPPRVGRHLRDRKRPVGARTVRRRGMLRAAVRLPTADSTPRASS